MKIEFYCFRKKFVECQGTQRVLQLPKTTESSLREVSVWGIFVFCRLLRIAITVVIAMNTQSKTAVQNMDN